MLTNCLKCNYKIKMELEYKKEKSFCDKLTECMVKFVAMVREQAQGLAEQGRDKKADLENALEAVNMDRQRHELADDSVKKSAADIIAEQNAEFEQ